MDTPLDRKPKHRSTKRKKRQSNCSAARGSLYRRGKRRYRCARARIVKPAPTAITAMTRNAMRPKFMPSPRAWPVAGRVVMPPPVPVATADGARVATATVAARVAVGAVVAVAARVAVAAVVADAAVTTPTPPPTPVATADGARVAVAATTDAAPAVLDATRAVAEAAPAVAEAAPAVDDAAPAVADAVVCAPTLSGMIANTTATRAATATVQIRETLFTKRLPILPSRRTPPPPRRGTGPPMG